MLICFSVAEEDAIRSLVSSPSVLSVFNRYHGSRTVGVRHSCVGTSGVEAHSTASPSECHNSKSHPIFHSRPQNRLNSRFQPDARYVLRVLDYRESMLSLDRADQVWNPVVSIHFAIAGIPEPVAPVRPRGHDLSHVYSDLSLCGFYRFRPKKREASLGTTEDGCVLSCAAAYASCRDCILSKDTQWYRASIGGREVLVRTLDCLPTVYIRVQGANECQQAGGPSYRSSSMIRAVPRICLYFIYMLLSSVFQVLGKFCRFAIICMFERKESFSEVSLFLRVFSLLYFRVSWLRQAEAHSTASAPDHFLLVVVSEFCGVYFSTVSFLRMFRSQPSMSVKDKEITLLTPHLVECCVLKLILFYFESCFLFLFRKSHIMTSHAIARALEVMFTFEGGVDLHGLNEHISWACAGRASVSILVHVGMCMESVLCV